MPSLIRKNLPVIACAVSQALALSPASAALPPDAVDATRATAYASPGLAIGKILQGQASVTHDTWIRYYQAGTQALDKRLYALAEQRLSAALAELRRRNVSDIRIVQTKESLGRALLGLEEYEDAERILTDAVMRASKLGASGDGARARASEALAETLFARGKFTKAEPMAKQAIDDAERAGVNEPRFRGKAYMTLADNLAAKGFDNDAGELYKKSIALLEKETTSDEHDLGEALYRYGLLLRAQDNQAEATTAFNRAFAIQDKLSHHNKALINAPRLNVLWQEGNPRARVVPDQDYPLKYVYVNGLRVAATLVRSENVIAVLISLSNCSRNRKELALGKVSLLQQSPKNKSFRYVAPVEIDVVLEAQHVTELTWRRRWLNHIEKTRRIPGYLKDGLLDVDNFLGNNTFGLYGSWQSVARNETPIVTREQFLYSPYRDPDPNDSADFLSQTPLGTRPTYLDVGDSKTGLLYFGQERFDKAVLKIVIGNNVVEIPFDSAGPR